MADRPRRAELSQAANGRSLTGLAEAETPLGQVADEVGRPVLRAGRRFRGLNPLSGSDAELAEVLLRGEFALNGFRNRDLRAVLCPASQTPTDAERRRCSNRISRLLRLFREQGLVRKVKGTHRYHLTAEGRRTLPAFLAARNASTEKLNDLAA